MNTAIEMTYADGNNSKVSRKVVLAGLINKEQIETIATNLDDGLYVIAEQVGLPTISVEFSDRYEFPTEVDHVWTKLDDFDGELPSPEDFVTHDVPSVGISTDEFVERMAFVEWNEQKELIRLGMSLYVD